jgi:hypothetical protein
MIVSLWINIPPLVPAKAGTQSFWIPAFAGMSGPLML